MNTVSMQVFAEVLVQAMYESDLTTEKIDEILDNLEQSLLLLDLPKGDA